MPKPLAMVLDSREGEATAAIVLARTGDIPRTEATLKDLGRRNLQQR